MIIAITLLLYYEYNAMLLLAGWLAVSNIHGTYVHFDTTKTLSLRLNVVYEVIWVMVRKLTIVRAFQLIYFLWKCVCFQLTT